VTTGTVYYRGRAKTLGNRKPAIVQVDHDDLRRRIELGRQQRRQSYRSGANNADGAARLNLAIQNPAFKSSRQNIAQHDEGFFVQALRDGIQAGVGMRYPHKFRLCPVDLVAQDPAACGAVGIHQFAAVKALAAGADAGNQDPVSWLERGDSGANGIDHPDTFMAKNPTGLTGRNVALENMKIGATDGRLRNPDHGVARRGDFRLRVVEQCLLAGSLINECFHCMASIGAVNRSRGPIVSIRGDRRTVFRSTASLIRPCSRA